MHNISAYITPRRKRSPVIVNQMTHFPGIRLKNTNLNLHLCLHYTLVYVWHDRKWLHVRMKAHTVQNPRRLMHVLVHWVIIMKWKCSTLSAITGNNPVIMLLCNVIMLTWESIAMLTLSTGTYQLPGECRSLHLRCAPKTGVLDMSLCFSHATCLPLPAEDTTWNCASSIKLSMDIWISLRHPLYHETCPDRSETPVH